jgi:predicted GNAT family N-acyltransferase
MKLQFIKYNSIYLKSCAKLISETWPLADDLVDACKPHHLFYYYIRNCVDNSIYTDLIIDEEIYRVLGILFDSDESHTTFKSYIENLKNSFILFKHILLGHLGKRLIALECTNDMLYTEKSIEKHCEELDDQINFCVLNKELQGIDYGRQLIDRYIQFCINERQMKKIFVWTDISCNYVFYEHCGFHLFKKFYDDRFTNHCDKRTDKPNGFIYIKNI